MSNNEELFQLLSEYKNGINYLEKNQNKEKTNKEYLINCFIFIIRLPFQIGEFYTCIIILNIFFELIFIFLGSATTSDNYFYHIYHILFSLLLSYLLIFPISLVFYELFKFNWINQKNPFFTINELFPLLNSDNEDSYFIIKLFLASFYLISFFFVFFNNNLFEKIFTYGIIIPNIIKYLLILVIYYINSMIVLINIYLQIKCNVIINYEKKIPDDPFIYSIY